MIWGAQASLLAGVVSVLIAVCSACRLGVVAGYRGGWIDAVISRITDALLAAPVPDPGHRAGGVPRAILTNAMIAIGLSPVPIFVRLARGQTLAVKTEDYVEGARAVGAGHRADPRAPRRCPTSFRRSWCRPR